MNETPALVVRAEGEYAVVETRPVSGCGRCETAGGCAGAGRGSLLSAAPRRYRVRNPLGARAGEQVVVAVGEGALLRGAAMAYGMPLLLLLGGAVLGAVLASSPAARDLYAAAGAGAGLAAGFAGARLIRTLGRGDPRSEPQILRRP